MKKVICLAAVAAMVACGSVAMADSFTVGVAGNIQDQSQVMGGVDLGANGGISGINQTQAGIGGSAAMAGSAGAEGQVQGENTTVSATNGFATHSYNSTAVTFGGSAAVNGGVGAQVEAQSVDGGIATVGDGLGTGSISGSAMQIDQGAAAGGLGFAGGASGAVADYNSDYTYTNTGATSSISQAGSQNAIMATGAGGTNGGGIAGLEATQVGGTAATNNGVGTSMAGAGASAGSIETANATATGAGGTAAAGSIGQQTQTHSYTQSASNGAQSQWAAGSVMTGNAVLDGSVVLP